MAGYVINQIGRTGDRVGDVIDCYDNIWECTSVIGFVVWALGSVTLAFRINKLGADPIATTFYVRHRLKRIIKSFVIFLAQLDHVARRVYVREGVSRRVDTGASKCRGLNIHSPSCGGPF